MFITSSIRNWENSERITGSERQTEASDICLSELFVAAVKAVKIR
jgi:hypothetical protein